MSARQFSGWWSVIRGFLSFEAVLSFAILILVLLSFPVQYADSNRVIFAHQKIGDFLIVSAYSSSAPRELLSDAELFFGTGNYEIIFGGAALKEESGKNFVREKISYLHHGLLVDATAGISLP